MTRHLPTAVALAIAAGVALLPAASAQEITPHSPLWTSPPTSWASPLDGGPLRVKFVVPRDAAGEVNALAHRVEIRSTTTTFDPAATESVNGAIAEALAEKFDVAVVCSVSLDWWGETELARLETLLEEGRGFVFLDFGERDPAGPAAWEQFGLREDPVDLLAGSGSSALSPVRDATPIIAVSGPSGRVVDVLFAGTRPPGQCLTPASVSFEFPALYENYLSIVARCIRWSARHEPAVRLVSLAHEPTPSPETEITPPQLPPRFIEHMSESLNPVRLRSFALSLNKPAPKSYGLRVQLRYPGRGVQWSYDAEEIVRKGESSVSLTIPAGSGEYFVDVWLMDGLRIVDWYTEPVTVEGRPRIADVQIAPAFAEPNDRMRVSLRVEPSARNVASAIAGSGVARGPNSTVIGRMLDPFGRVAALQSIPVDPDNEAVRFDMPIADWIGPYGRAELYVTDGYDHNVSWWLRQTATYAGTDVIVRQPRRTGLSWIADAPGGSGHVARGVRQRLALLGVDRAATEEPTRDVALAADGLMPVVPLPAPEVFPCGMDLGENSVDGRRIREAASEHGALRPGLYSIEIGPYSTDDEACSELFAGFLARRYERIEKLNNAWQTDLAGWDAAVSRGSSSAQARADALAFEARTREAYRAAVQSLVRRNDPNAILGVPDVVSSGEWHIAEATALDVAPRPYARPEYLAVRSPLPTGKSAEAHADWLPWFAALHGANALWSRDIGVETFADEGAVAAITSLSATIGDVRAGYDILFQAAARPAPAALIILPMPGESSKSTEAWAQLIESHLVRFEVSAEYLLDDVDPARYKLAILPARTVVSTSAAEWLNRFRGAGGALASDGAPGSLGALFTDDGGLTLSFTESIELDDWSRDQNEAFVSWLGQAGIPTNEGLRIPSDFRGHIRDLRLGSARLIAMVSAPDATSTASVRMEVAKDEYLYAPFGDVPGPLRRASAHLAPGEAALFAVSPYEVTRIVVDAPEAADAGTRLEVFATVKTRGALPGTHVLHVRLLDPAGSPLRLYDRTIVAHDGHGVARIPLAYNEVPGRYRVVVRDVMTGVEAIAEIKVS